MGRTTDEACPLRETIGHRCASRDAVELEAAGRPPLKPDGDCHEGAAYAMAIESQARQASIGVLTAARGLLAVMAEYGYLHGDCEVEAMQLADATGVAGFAYSLAWGAK